MPKLGEQREKVGSIFSVRVLPIDVDAIEKAGVANSRSEIAFEE